ncbi:ead/Ea22-like family protein [Pseudomonas sp. NPDC077408]|uniref:ead/Ea22-like family protein n=1 Tax=Streptomyces parvus TaxID=66428 RepID=UPI0037216546
MSKWNELKKLAEAATPGPWSYDGSYICPARVEGETTYVESWSAIADSHQMENVRFIAAANPATVLELIAENERLKADKNTVDCRFEVSRDTLEVIRGCLRQAESEIDQMKAHAVERRGVSRALHEAVSAIYFDDSSDYESALWAVVRNLAPELIEELESDPSAVWHKTEALAKQEASK